MVSPRLAGLLGAGLLLGCNSISGLSGLEKCDDCGSSGAAGSAGAAGASASGPKQFGVGPKTSCLTMSDGALWCWGANPGVAPGSVVTKPTRVVFSDPTVKVASAAPGYEHACALDETGRLWCWGRNDYGQLGTGDTSPSPEPKVVPGLPAISSFALGSTHTCAGFLDGDPVQVFCWGRNNNGQLGNDTTTDSSKPIPLVFDDGAKPLRISAGDELTCAVVDSAGALEVRCWGRNDKGQCGLDVTTNPVTKPTKVPLTETMERVYVGASHVCTRTTVQKYPWCWGANESGQLGHGTLSAYAKPAAVVGVGAIPIDTMWSGARHSCFVDEDSFKGICWGANDVGQFGGNPPPSSGSGQPVEAPFLNDAAANMKYANHGCKIDSNTNEIYCWGANENGQLGNGKTEPFSAPVKLTIPP